FRRRSEGARSPPLRQALLEWRLQQSRRPGDEPDQPPSRAGDPLVPPPIGTSCIAAPRLRGFPEFSVPHWTLRLRPRGTTAWPSLGCTPPNQQLQRGGLTLGYVKQMPVRVNPLGDCHE